MKHWLESNGWLASGQYSGQLCDVFPRGWVQVFIVAPLYHDLRPPYQVPHEGHTPTFGAQAELHEFHLPFGPGFEIAHRLRSRCTFISVRHDDRPIVHMLRDEWGLPSHDCVPESAFSIRSWSSMIASDVSIVAAVAEAFRQRGWMLCSECESRGKCGDGS